MASKPCKSLKKIYQPDVIMPEMNAYQLAAIVKEKYPTIKIQLSSGFADKHHAYMMDDDLWKNLLHKPFDSQTLLKKIQDSLDEKGGDRR